MSDTTMNKPSRLNTHSYEHIPITPDKAHPVGHQCHYILPKQGLTKLRQCAPFFTSLLSLRLYTIDLMRRCYPVRATRQPIAYPNTQGTAYHPKAIQASIPATIGSTPLRAAWGRVANHLTSLWKQFKGRGEREGSLRFHMYIYDYIHTRFTLKKERFNQMLKSVIASTSVKIYGVYTLTTLG